MREWPQPWVSSQQVRDSQSSDTLYGRFYTSCCVGVPASVWSHRQGTSAFLIMQLRRPTTQALGSHSEGLTSRPARLLCAALGCHGQQGPRTPALAAVTTCPLWWTLLDHFPFPFSLLFMSVCCIQSAFYQISSSLLKACHQYLFSFLICIYSILCLFLVTVFFIWEFVFVLF